MTATTTDATEATRAFYEERAEAIRRRIMDAVERAASEVFDDEAISAKYRSVSYDAGTARIGFRDGIGFEIRVVEVYRPETPAES